jgi:hypothetical protein
VTPDRRLRAATRPCLHHIGFAQAHRVASAFLDAPREPPSETAAIVRAAYADLARQADRWFAWLTGAGSPAPIRVVHTRRPEPYVTGRELSERVRAERVLELCPAAVDGDRSHPLLDTAPGGTYDRFRVVHDLVSHASLGFGFDRDGEFSGWLNEDRMYHGLARWALATELHGEHSVRWTTGNVAEHKATLLPPGILRDSRRHGLVEAFADRRHLARPRFGERPLVAAIVAATSSCPGRVSVCSTMNREPACWAGVASARCWIGS